MINVLVEKIKKTEAPIVVGLDPTMELIPKYLMNNAIKDYGENFEAVGEAIFEYNKAIIDAVYDLVPAVKPQIAMYEQFGIFGLMAYEKTIKYSKEKGLIVIGDIKRGDIGSTSTAYALGHLGSVKVGNTVCRGFDEDFATVNPYLGTDGIKPFIDVCREEKKGIFVLVKTSNPSSGEFQDRKIDDKALYEIVGAKVREWGESHMSCSGDIDMGCGLDNDVKSCGYSYVGAVVGATYPEVGKIMREAMPKTYILVPGYGAQGGTAKDLSHFFNKDGLGAIINSSRGIIGAYKMEKYAKYGDENFGDAAREAVITMREDIKAVLA